MMVFSRYDFTWKGYIDFLIFNALYILFSGMLHIIIKYPDNRKVLLRLEFYWFLCKLDIHIPTSEDKLGVYCECEQFIWRDN